MKNFITLLPPPNITGSLHIGHYFNWTLQDFVIRYKKQHGFQTQWILGLDHAGISTQYIVEKQLAEKGQTRLSLGREKFHHVILEWKEKAEELIQRQVDLFQFDMDWDTKHFTMEAPHQLTVKKAFCKLYNDGLISKQLKVTNWDTKFNTAISDLEVIERTEKSKIYIIEYQSTTNHPPIKVATTRPETIFADVALCLHPNDPRKTHLQNQEFFIPLIHKPIPIIFDELCQQNKGEGVLKITPAHDFLDYEIGQKHNLEAINIINKEGKLYNTIKEIDGLSVEEARKKILQLFKHNNIIFQEEDWEGIKKYTEKSNVPCETILTEQWFLDVSKMANAALKASQEIEFFPSYLRNTFENWMKNIKPWCISRQIWWGHQIPIWYTSKGNVICALTQEEAQNQAPGETLTQDPDVLDTWFSSALWANLTPEQIDVLITGKDILFFWVARMIMFSLYLYNKNPFKTLYFNGIVRDKHNQKMSKTKGNVINPIELIKTYGQDALRFTLLKNAGNNKDIKLNEKEVELSRNFITKIKNADNFLKKFMKREDHPHEDLERWIINKLLQHQLEIEQHIQSYEFQKAAESFYELTWDFFCNWYLEGLKTYPSNNAITYFQHLLHLGVPFLPQTVHNLLSPNYQPLNQTKQTETFEKTIKIVNFLRKMKKLTTLQEIHTTYEPQMITNYTKLKINTQLTTHILIEDELIYMNPTHLTEFRRHLEKNIMTLSQENHSLQEKLKNNKAPEEIQNVWTANIINNKTQLKELKNMQLLVINSLGQQ